MAQFLKNLSSKLKTKETIIYLLIFILFIVNFKYVSYPDEFVNLLGGQYINKGLLPYKDFFDHHLPFAWYLAAIMLNFSGQSFVVFRFLWVVISFTTLFLLGLWIRKNHKGLYNYYLFFFFLYPLVSLYFWFHLYLADSLAALFFSVAFWLLMAQTIEKKVNFKALLVSTLAVFLLVFSSLAFAYLALPLYLWHAYLLRFKFDRKMLLLIFWCALPYALYILFLLITRTLKDFYFANFVYNTQLYISIPNYVRGRFFNPIKFGLTLMFNFYSGYLPLLSKLKHFDLYFPIGVLSGFSTLVLFLILLIKNRFAAFIYFLVLSFSAPRSNIQNFNETDYQVSMFLILGTASALIVLYILKSLNKNEGIVTDIKKVSRFIIAFLLLFSTIFLVINSYNKYYLRYTQKIPSFTDKAFTAIFIDTILDKDDYYWAGPYEPNELFFVKKARLPGKYISLLPQFKENEYTKTTFLEQFEKNTPKVIIYKHDASIFQTPSLEFGDFFLDWMKDKYTSVENIQEVEVLSSPSGFNIRTDLYLLNREQENLLARLKNNGYIKINLYPSKKK